MNIYNIASTSKALEKANKDAENLPENYLENLSKDIANNFVGGLMSPIDLATHGINLALPEEKALNLPSSYIPQFDLSEEYEQHASDALLPKVLTNISAFTAPAGFTRGIVKGLNQGRKALKNTKNLKFAGKKLKKNIKESVIQNSFTPNAVLGGAGAGTGVALYEHLNNENQDHSDNNILGKLASALVGGMFGNAVATRYVGNKVAKKIPKIDNKKVKFSEIEKAMHPIYKDIDQTLLGKAIKEEIPVTLNNLDSNRAIQKIASKYSNNPVYLNILNNQKNKIAEKLNLSAEKGDLDSIGKKITEIANEQKKAFDAKHTLDFAPFREPVKQLPIEKQQVDLTDLSKQLQDLITEKFGTSDTAKLQMKQDPVVRKVLGEPLIEKLINPIEKSNSEKIVEFYNDLDRSKGLIDQNLLADQLIPTGRNKQFINKTKKTIDDTLANFESKVSGVPIEEIKKTRGEYAKYLETVDPVFNNIKENAKEALERRNLDYLLKELKEGRPIAKEILQKNPDLAESALSYLIKSPQNQLEIDKLSKVIMNNNIPLNDKQKSIIDLFNALELKKSQYNFASTEDMADKILDVVKGAGKASFNALKKIFTNKPSTKIPNNLNLLTNQKNLKIIHEIQPYLKQLKNAMVGETIFEKAGSVINELPYAMTKNIKRAMKSASKSGKVIDADTIDDSSDDQNLENQQKIDVPKINYENTWSTNYEEGWKKAKVLNPKTGQYVTLYLNPNMYNAKKDYYLANGVKFDE